MKHKNKLIEQKRHANAIMTTAVKRYLVIPTWFQSDFHVSDVMAGLNLGERARDIAVAINNALEKYENSQKP